MVRYARAGLCGSGLAHSVRGARKVCGGRRRKEGSRQDGNRRAGIGGRERAERLRQTLACRDKMQTHTKRVQQKRAPVR